jgi:ComF family protein
MLCPPCAHALPALGAACARCALPGDAPLCIRCARKPPPWTRAVAAWRYAYPVDRLLQALKYGGQLALAEPLADGLAHAVLARGFALPDLIVPLPLSVSRQRERGFDQARLIARRVAQQCGRPLLPALVRVRDSGPQAALPLARRAANVRDAFVGRVALAGARVALVDDVMTTGATLGEAARALQRSGAREIEAWVAARTLPPSG